MVSEHHGAVAFDRSEVVDSYAGRSDLTPCESALFSRWVPPGARTLDLGVGTGRTTRWLLQRSSSYIGIDLAPNMVAAACAAHPTADLRIGDAADLGDLARGSVDVVVFAFNGIDYLSDLDRHRCLVECRRVLTSSGVLIFSTHNQRALVASPPAGATWARRAARIACGTAVRAPRLLRSPAFFHHEGWVMDRAQGGLLTHMAVPSQVTAELVRHGFQVVDRQNGDLPAAPRWWRTPWWYYVATPASGPAASRR